MIKISINNVAMDRRFVLFSTVLILTNHWRTDDNDDNDDEGRRIMRKKKIDNKLHVSL